MGLKIFRSRDTEPFRFQLFSSKKIFATLDGYNSSWICLIFLKFSGSIPTLPNVKIQEKIFSYKNVPFHNGGSLFGLTLRCPQAKKFFFDSRPRHIIYQSIRNFMLIILNIKSWVWKFFVLKILSYLCFHLFWIRKYFPNFRRS